ncbi:hypothetical protein MBEBAB_1356 [Brevundimonas abyssalis TAR-001]|uniref:Prepilin type IV endopeptidase peptidase domain-containing protein n=1 Tax=Brevundimonas abyssalis TAR-001 TaxID=1391729 RepID=A0A8E0KJ10_9CAUL|nr:hypothetical protein MBEBAB_1356 [Brevundimonas abyssalis TAR-001]
MEPGTAGLMLVLPLTGAGLAAGLGAAVLTARLDETGPGRASPILMTGLAVLGAAVGVWSLLGPAPIVVTALLGWSLLLIAAVDARHFWLPDWLTLPLLAGGLAATALFDRPALIDHLIGAAAASPCCGGLRRCTAGREGGRDWAAAISACWRRRGPGPDGWACPACCCGRPWPASVWFWRVWC